MKESIICLWGSENYGKSSVINYVYQLLSPPATNIHGISYQGNSLPWKRGDEILDIVNYNGIKIGIESESCTNGIQSDTVNFLDSQGCKIIVCASKFHGPTVDHICVFNGKYDLFWMSPFYYSLNVNSQNRDTRLDNINMQTAKSVVDFIDGLISGNI